MKKILKLFENDKFFLFAVLGCAFFLRLAYVVKTGAGGLSPDSYDWMNVAWSVASGNGFGDSWRPPGYIFYLAGVFSVFGKSVVAVKFLNILLGVSGIYFCYLVAASLFNRSTAKLTAILICFYPYLIAYTADLLSETFLTFILSAAILSVVRASEKPVSGRLVLAGFLIGCAGLTKSVVLPFFLIACAWLWWQTGKFRAGFLVGIFTLLTIMPWTFRNYFQHDKNYIMPVSTPWYSLYGSTCDEALLNETTGDVLKGPGVAQIDQFTPPDWNEVGAMPLLERDKYCKTKALSWIRNNPQKFIWLLYKRCLHFWRLYPVIAYKWQKIIAIATSGIYLPLAGIGILLSWQEYKKRSLLCALFVAYTAVHLFFATMLRYRVPIDPYIIMFSAYAITYFYGRLCPAK